MFPATMYPSLGETAVFMRHLVLVILCGWLSVCRAEFHSAYQDMHQVGFIYKIRKVSVLAQIGIWHLPNIGVQLWLYTLSNKNPSAWNFLSPEPEVTCGTVAIIIRVVLLSPYLRIRGVSLSSIHYNQSHRVYTCINRRQKYICLIGN
jgi:hypothetical protein